MWKDPIVEEVRKVRHEIEAENRDDFERIFSSALEIQNQCKDRVVSRPKHLTEEEMLSSLSRI
jgi:ethanolamine utilization cobalamin adenosyltransferase